jgi:hypothetical protein
MVTAWIPLTPCGVDAPGLELLEGSRDALYSTESLRDPDPGSPRWTPSMEAGDVMLMSGRKVHRTHVTGGMGAVRTCIELRFVSAEDPPQRFVDHLRMPLRHWPRA